MRVEHQFRSDIDRYHFDFSLVGKGKPFAQFNTPEDAAWFGIWCDPRNLIILCYAEGDITRQFFDTNEAFCNELRRQSARYDHSFGKPAHLEPGFDQDLRQSLVDLGLGDLL